MMSTSGARLAGGTDGELSGAANRSVADTPQNNEHPGPVLEIFMAVTQITDEGLALRFLEAASWNVEDAVANALDNPEGPPTGRRESNSVPSYSAVAARGVASLASGSVASAGSEVRHRVSRTSDRTAARQHSSISGGSPAASELNEPVARFSVISIFTRPISFVCGAAWRLLFVAVSFVPFLDRWLSRVAFDGRRISVVPPHNAKRTSELFRMEFEMRYGINHPTFYEDGYTQALNHAKETLKFLLVLLQSDEHDDTDTFNRTIISSPEFLAFCNKHDFVVWAANIKEPEALQVSSLLSATAYPFLALIVYQRPPALGPGPAKMVVVERIEGLQPLDVVLRLLAAQYDRCSPPLVRLRAERTERETARRIREMQDAAYAESLKVDREKERRAAEERERARLKEERARREKIEKAEWEEAKGRHRARLLATLSSEPTGNDDVTHLSFKLLSGERVVRRFRNSEPVENLYIYVDTLTLSRSLANGGNEPKNQALDTQTAGGKHYTHSYDFVLVAPYPRKEYTDLSMSLEEAGGLCPSAGLIVEMADTTEEEG